MDHSSLKWDFSWHDMVVNLTSLDCFSDRTRLFFLVCEWFLKRSVKQNKFTSLSKKISGRLWWKQLFMLQLSTFSFIELLALSFATEQVVGMNVSIPLVFDLSALGYCRKWRCLYKRAAVRFNWQEIKKKSQLTLTTREASLFSSCVSKVSKSLREPLSRIKITVFFWQRKMICTPSVPSELFFLHPHRKKRTDNGHWTHCFWSSRQTSSRKRGTIYTKKRKLADESH